MADISTQRNLTCIAKGTSKSCQLLNLVTGDRFSLPEGLSQEHTPRKLDFMNYRASVALGQVALTGEFKLLRVIDKPLKKSPVNSYVRSSHTVAAGVLAGEGRRPLRIMFI